MSVFIHAASAVLGLLIGSFLNVVIYRLPRECLSVWKQARSLCPRCGVQLRWFDNVPVLSWVILLRGRCRGCGVGIPWRYPFNELLVGLAFFWFASRDLQWSDAAGPVGLPVGGWGIMGVHCLVFSVLVSLTWIDLDFRILPDALTLPGIVVAPLISGVLPESMPSLVIGPFDSIWGIPGANVAGLANGLVGVLVAGGGLWLIGFLGTRAFKKPAMGLGDVKLFAAMGGLLGLWSGLALMLACLVGSVVGIGVLLVSKERYVPFGPFLAVGMMVTWLHGPELFQALLLRVF